MTPAEDSHFSLFPRMNKQLRDAFDPLAAQSGGVASLTSADLVTLAVDGDVLAETVRDRLLGDLGRAVGCGLSVEGLETQTPGEKMARQVIAGYDLVRVWRSVFMLDTE